MERAFAIIPAVDVLDDRAVRLTQGDYERVDVAGDPLELVERAASAHPPFVHVVALGAARDGDLKTELVRAVAEAASPIPIQFGGGVRSVADAIAIVDAGAARVVIGTAAFGKVPLETFVEEVDIVVAVDVADGIVRTEGWLESSGLTTADALARCMDAGVERVLCTAIGRDGTRSGPDLSLLREVRSLYDGEVMGAGGIRDADDVEAVRALGIDGVVVGRAWIEGTLEL
ncbi:MAG TPA: HisA/HisF-related TIM barrel protein [Gaiellaceae bacterium]|nr:HisA/HisF-related TIM barrel protein [Gaiellaceae bacterium]